MASAEISKEKQDVNILILGATGVGKSTWINGIANYAKYNSLQNAMDDSEFTALIPLRFLFVDDTGEEKDISFGSDSNEELKDGQSATQCPREYVIDVGTTKYHLIDTPGIGDCRGTEQDKKNFDSILSFLTPYDKIHAVVMLLKPNDARLTVAFRFCVVELFTHLHKSLVKNIIFAFTNSRGTFYKPGDTLPALKKLLASKKIDITLSPSTYVCFDNEAFRFLACHKKGVEFTSREVNVFSESWDISRDTTLKLFNLIKSMPPYDTREILSLNEARSCIVAMSKPMGEAVQLIELNLKKVNDAKALCSEDDFNIKKLQKKLRFKGFERKTKVLDHPRTVCAHVDCRKYEYIGETREKITTFPQICHDRCPLEDVQVESTNNEKLSGCKVMSNDGDCKKCTHNYKAHMHITYTTTIVEKEFLAKVTQSKINDCKNSKAQREAFITELERNIEELEKEKKFIFECASHYGVFLDQNAMIPYNDSFSDYLDMLIKEEEMKEKVIRDDKRIAELKESKQAYEQQKEIITKSIQSSSDSDKKELYMDRIFEMKEKLCSLKHNGNTLKEALDFIKSARKKRREVESKKNYLKASSKTFLESIGNYFQQLKKKTGSNEQLA